MEMRSKRLKPSNSDSMAVSTLVGNLLLANFGPGDRFMPNMTGVRRLVPSCLAVAFTCRQLCMAVTPIYYSREMFAVSLTSMVIALEIAQDFAVANGPENAR